MTGATDQERAMVKGAIEGSTMIIRSRSGKIKVVNDLNNEIYELIRECNVNNYHNITIYL